LLPSVSCFFTIEVSGFIEHTSGSSTIHVTVSNSAAEMPPTSGGQSSFPVTGANLPPVPSTHVWSAQEAFLLFPSVNR
jgi:hypothetical protein